MDWEKVNAYTDGYTKGMEDAVGYFMSLLPDMTDEKAELVAGELANLKRIACSDYYLNAVADEITRSNSPKSTSS